jgi:RNA polymerase sigma factor for flagellar operon FliA
MNVHKRNELIERSMHLVRGEAERLRRRLPASVELDDLVNDGVLGLMEALDRFDPSKATLRTFAARRIRGAMLDGLRSRDPVSRATRSAIRNVEATADRMRLKTGVNPSPEELAREMSISERTYSKIALWMRDTVTRSLSGQAMRGGESGESSGQTAADSLPDNRQDDPSRAFARKIVREEIATGFSRSERLIITLYYYEQMTMKEIGATLDLSESRVSQMHSSIVARLKTRLTESQLVA